LTLLLSVSSSFRPKNEPDLTNWKHFLGILKNPTSEVKIGLVGKYVELKDAYKSIAESLIHAGVENECKVEVEWIHSEDLKAGTVASKLKGLKVFWLRLVLATEELKGNYLLCNTQEKTRFHFLGFVWECNVPWLSLDVTCLD